MADQARAVWKYPLRLVDGPQELGMPPDARVVHVATQDVVTPTLWAEGTVPATTTVTRRFLVHGTGHHIDHDGTYVGTCHTHHGAMVWHIYELSPRYVDLAVRRLAAATGNTPEVHR